MNKSVKENTQKKEKRNERFSFILSLLHAHKD